ncbi:MAG: hypothetical protein HAW62_02250 [Endozoicomonadaceae bacterium]|nr:hypothetical protein [Endozoicomonadaceae bacterium]
MNINSAIKSIINYSFDEITHVYNEPLAASSLFLMSIVCITIPTVIYFCCQKKTDSHFESSVETDRKTLNQRKQEITKITDGYNTYLESLGDWNDLSEDLETEIKDLNTKIQNQYEEIHSQTDNIHKLLLESESIKDLPLKIAELQKKITPVPKVGE